MSEKEKKILETLGNTISKMSEGEKGLSFGGLQKGMAAMKEKKTEKEEKAG